MSRYPMFDASRLRLKPLSEREHDMTLDYLLALGGPFDICEDPGIAKVAAAIRKARADGRAVILMMGAHVIKQGTSRFVIDLMRRGMVTHVAMNGAGAVHDFELAMIGASTERVAKYIRKGEFGMWTETGWINDAVCDGAAAGMGFGESVGTYIIDKGFPHCEISILATGVELGVPVTNHVAIGLDIIHQHPNFDAAATGIATYRDFLMLAKSVENLEGGVLICAGSAVMGPEAFLKALSMARNVAEQEGRKICHFTTAVLDLIPITGDLSTEAPKTDARYYYRPWKTLLIRTVNDGGVSHYIQGDHRSTIPTLHKEITK